MRRVAFIAMGLALAIASFSTSVAAAEPLPVVEGMSTFFGSPAGGDEVTIVGTAFAGVTDVSFGETSSPSFRYSALSGYIRTFTPPGTGVVDVRVTTPAGTSEIVLKDRYAYIVRPEFGRCLKQVNSGTGKFAKPTCLVGLSETTSNYEWYPLFSRKPAVRGFSLKAGELISKTPVLLQTKAGAKFYCFGGTALGEYTGQQTLALGPIALTGCKEKSGTPCQTEGQLSGEIVTAALVGQLGRWRKEFTPKIGVALSPSSGETFAEFACGSLAVTVKGAFIINTPFNKMLASAKWVATEKTGVQIPNAFEGAAELTLTAQVGSSATYETAGLKMNTIAENQEPIEIDNELP